MTAELLHFNGINGATGGYGLAPMSGERLAKLILNEEPADNLKDLEARKKADDEKPEAIERLRLEQAALEAELGRGPDAPRAKQIQIALDKVKKELARRQHMGVKEGVKPTLLAEAGWGVIFPKSVDPAVKEALKPLLDLRASQAGDKFRLYDGPRCYRTDETKSQFLVRNGASPSGPADPDKVPYYLLIVGSPEEISYTFQYQLDVQYAVGRLHFATALEYANYAANVVAAETGGIARAKSLGFFAVNNPGDLATDLSSRLLVSPLAEELAKNKLGWSTQVVAGAEATRARLGNLLGGGESPALLFTASHGMEFPLHDPRQLSHQGALLCSDWPGPEAWKGKGPIPEDFYFAGDHLSSSADLQGMVVFAFACYGAGVPLHDEFSRQAFKERKQIAPVPFVSALPSKLLGRPRGALAVIGHVDRAWGCSFSGGSGPRQKSYTTTFQSALERLMKGQQVGYALDYFNERYAEISTVLSEELSDIEFGKNYDPYELSQLWTANNDAKTYVVLGDPAARLCFEGGAVLGSSSVTLSSGSSAGSGASGSDAPAGISAEDWGKTPDSVKQLVARLMAK